MSEKNYKELLQAPFKADEIEWRVQSSGIKNGKVWCMVLAYVQSRAIMDRLDDVFGIEGWQNKFEKAPDGGVMCGISFKHDGEWITKWDGAENTAIEGVKGGLSSAMKRAAVPLGIGRYLYKLDATFANVSATKVQNSNYFKGEDRYTKEKYSGYWTVPKLPAWALPKTEKVKQNPQEQEQEEKVKPDPLHPEDARDIKEKLAKATDLVLLEDVYNGLSSILQLNATVKSLFTARKNEIKAGVK